ncbi:hypothetical protein CR513_04010, partial [Mucuna pruriens]
MGYAQPSYTNVPPPHNVKDPPYGMTYGWNTGAPVNKEHKYPIVNTALGARPANGGSTHAQ